MTVYVVIEYWHSDTLVKAIWSTRELAVAFIELYEGNVGIEEFIVDETILKLG